MNEFKPLSADYVRHLLHYDPLTGIWTWINPEPRQRARKGEAAGSLNGSGRRLIKVSGTYFYSSRLAYFYMTSEWPEAEMDHINRIKSDDRWNNLRQATRSQNAYNIARYESEWRGITKVGCKFRVQIGNKHLGQFVLFEEARAVRDQALEDWAGPFAVKG